MDVTLPYGESTLTATLPDRTVRIRPAAGSRDRPVLAPAPDGLQTVRDALAAPMGLPRIRDHVRAGSKVMVAFDDGTVSTTTGVRRIVLDGVLEELGGAGVRDEDITLVCANALHRKWSREELTSMLGADLMARFGEKIVCHDAEDHDNLVYCGTTPEHGYDVEVHRLVRDSDLAVYLNCGVSLGFTGGWKSVVVGLSTWRSIRWTHTPDGMSMSVRDNRMHAVFEEMGAHLERQMGKRVFKVETLNAGPGRIARVWAGGIAETRAAVMEVQQSISPPRRDAAPARADVIVYGLPNASPYAAFARVNPILTLISSGLGYQGGYIEALGRPGCSVVLATPCPDDWDRAHHPAYPEVWDRVLPVTRDPYEITARFGEEFATHKGYIDLYRNSVAYHPVHAILATHPLKRLKHAGRVFVAGAHDPDVPRHIGFIPTPTVEDAIAEAEKIHGKDCSIACIG